MNIEKLINIVLKRGKTYLIILWNVTRSLDTDPSELTVGTKDNICHPFFANLLLSTSSFCAIFSVKSSPLTLIPSGEKILTLYSKVWYKAFISGKLAGYIFAFLNRIYKFFFTVILIVIFISKISITIVTWVIISGCFLMRQIVQYYTKNIYPSLLKVLH